MRVQTPRGALLPAFIAEPTTPFKAAKLLLICTAFLLAIHCHAGAQQSSADDDVHYDPVKITNGPVVEYVTDTKAQIAWSTNVNSGTMLFYGENPDFLDKTASMPWGGITHRVQLKDLKPGTKYYFRAESGKGQGTGTTATAQVKSFQTK
jgi:Purple acid Phosphatase, N-terminal domain